MTDPFNYIPGPLPLVHALNEAQPEDYTETGLVKKFMRRYGDQIKYDHESGIMYIWSDKGTHWEPDFAGQIFEMTETVVSMLQAELETVDEANRNNLLDAIRRASSRSTRNNVALMIRSQPKVAILGFQEKPKLLATPSGTINLETGELRANEPSDMLTACTSVTYTPGYTSDFLERQLDIFLPDLEVRQLFWDFLGAAVLGGNRLRVLGLFIGNTTSGKSMITEAVKNTLGKFMMPVNSSIFRTNLDDKPRPDMMKAMKARIVYASEGARVWELHGDQIKRITGQDTLPVRNMYKEIIHVTPNFTPIIVCNEMPGIKGADLALKRRILPIRFTPMDPDLEDPSVRTQFVMDTDVQKAILTKIVDGARSQLAISGVNSTTINAKTQELRDELFGSVDIYVTCMNDLIEHGFIEKAPEGTPASRCIKALDLFRLYEHWYMKNSSTFDKKEKVNTTAFGRAMMERNYSRAEVRGTRYYTDFVLKNMPEYLRFA